MKLCKWRAVAPSRACGERSEARLAVPSLDACGTRLASTQPVWSVLSCHPSDGAAGGAPWRASRSRCSDASSDAPRPGASLAGAAAAELPAASSQRARFAAGSFVDSTTRQDPMHTSSAAPSSRTSTWRRSPTPRLLRWPFARDSRWPDERTTEIRAAPSLSTWSVLCSVACTRLTRLSRTSSRPMVMPSAISMVRPPSFRRSASGMARALPTPANQ